MACSYYNNDTTTGIDKCSDSCANKYPSTAVEYYINEYAVGCGICKSAYAYHQLVAISFLDNAYIKTCSATSKNNSCSIIEYYNPYYDDCQRCACKFANCAACTIDECTFYYDSTIDTSNCTYHDPCVKYETGTDNCMECKDMNFTISSSDSVYYTYQLIIVNSSLTICGTYGTATQFGYTADNYMCGVLDSYYANYSFYGNMYYASGKDSYCIACDVYFNNDEGVNLCADECYMSGVGQSYLQRSISTYSVGCGSCAVDDYLMQTITPISFISGLYLASCSENVDGNYCDLTQYYDTDEQSCISCSSLFPQCAACSSSECYICAENYYLSTQMIYSYSEHEFVPITQCVYQNCPTGHGILDYSQNCQSCDIVNCHSCSLNSTTNEAYCTQCVKDYYSALGGAECLQYSTDVLQLTYYVSSESTYIQSNSSSNTYDSSFSCSPSNPYYFIQAVLHNISQMSINNMHINATVYIGSGNHFFFFCTSEWSNGLTGIVEFCDESTLIPEEYLKAWIYTDDITITFLALECSFADGLGYKNNADFDSMCIDLDTDSKPIIYINQQYASFQLRGSTTFQNLKFSGVNQFVEINSALYDLSILPILYCEVYEEPTPDDIKLSLSKKTVESFTPSFYCQQTWTSFNNIPTSTSSTYTCERNSDTQFYEYEESTLKASGEPDQSDFFVQGDTFVQTYSGMYPKRGHTLFNILTFPEYLSLTGAVPELIIDNCDFEYFLNDYDSLINVDNSQIWNTTVTQQYNAVDFNLESEDWEFFVYKGGERGIKLTVLDSTFKHSQFTKGLIVYRKQPYISTQLGMTNLTYLYMNSPFVQDSGSHITIHNSYFYNLNFLKNVTALAIYGGEEVTTNLYDYLSDWDIKYQVFMHKGIVLNVEDFGGDIYIYNSTFEANMHFIPEVLITPHSSSITRSIASFKDSAYSLEYKMSYCDQTSYTDVYFFQNGVSSSDDLDDYYDDFERLSLIYVSRNRGNVVVRDSTFLNNMGTFGGAISINSMNKQISSTGANIIIYNNNFTENMAYFSGNSIYIRLTESLVNVDELCGGGIVITNNTFDNNIGMKVHNGGAVAVSCPFIDQDHQDYYSRSSFDQDEEDSLDWYQMITDPTDGTEFQVPKYALWLFSNEFTENYSGLKGTAVYLSYLCYQKIQDNTFTQNGPVLSYFETQYSPYYKYFSTRAITFYDETGQCTNEFDYISNCLAEDVYIDFAYIQGALYVGHCQEEYCMISTNTEILYMYSNTFDNNQAGPILSDYFDNSIQSSQIFIEGGFSNTLLEQEFNNNNGLYFDLVEDGGQNLIDYFPPNYFYAQQSSLITIEVNPVAQYASSKLTLATTFSSCSFKNNYNYQVLGFSDQVYEGSLIKYLSYYGETTNNFIPTLTISESYFYDNQFVGPYSSLISVENGILYFNSNTVKNNGLITSTTYDSPTYTIFTYTYFTSYSISGSQMYGIIKINGDQTLPDSLYHIINYNTFTFTFSQFGSVYTLFLEGQYCLIESNTYSYNFASKQGSVLNALGSVSQSLIVMNNEDISYQFSLNGTLAVTSFSDTKMSLIVNNTKMYQLFSREGSAINLLSAQKVIINSCSFDFTELSVSVKEQVVDAYDEIDYLLIHYIDITYTDALSIHEFTSAQAHIYIDTVDGSSQNDFAGILTQSDSDEYASYVEITNCIFSNLYADAGSVIYISDSKVKYENAYNSDYGIYNCSQIEFGVIYVDNYAEFVGINLIMQDNYASYVASVLFLSQGSNATFINSQFLSNYAEMQGMTILQGSSSFTCDNCTFVGNYAYDSSVIFADNNPSGEIIISNSHFENNTSLSNLFYIIYTTCYVYTSTFLNNIAQKVNHGFTIVNSQLTLSQIYVYYTNSTYLDDTSYNVDTGFININFYSTLVVSNSTFKNVIAKTSGVLYGTGQSVVTIEDHSYFQDCYSDSGAIIYLASTDPSTIISTVFVDNAITDVWINNANLTVQKCHFIKGYDEFIYAETSSSLILESSTLENGVNTDVIGKGVYCECLNFTATKNKFTNLEAAAGGAIYIESSSLGSVFFIQNNVFTNNTAQLGGAIFIDQAPFACITGNQFVSNIAAVISPSTSTSSSLYDKGQGGAIYYKCTSSSIDLDSNCNVTIGETNTFTSNYAENDGGAIIWVTNDFITDNTNIFNDNYAYYGTNIASYPKDITIDFLKNNDYYNPVDNSNSRRLEKINDDCRLLDDLNGFNALVSGTAFQFLIYILDQEGNIYTTDSSSVATLSASSSEILLKNNEITADNGVYNFSDILVYAPPGSSLDLSLSISGLETYGNTVSFVDTPVDISVTFRSCVSGEELTSSNACVACSNGTYAYTAPTEQSECQECSEYATCYGKDITAPIAGYWRANATTESWVECPREKSCLGGDQTNFTGRCAEGYEGIACTVCEVEYSVTSAFTCAACPPKIRNIVQISFIMFFAAMYTTFLTKSTMESANKVKPLYNVYLKIMTNHFQVIGAISNIDFDWPSQIESFYSAQVKTSSVSTQIFSFDCFLFANKHTADIGVYYEKLMFYAFSPIILTALSTIFWLCNCAYHKNYSYFKDSLISTVVVLLFLIHPDISTAMFSAFNCIELDGVFYLRLDPASICYQGHHLFYVLVVIMPSIIIWVIGIPLFAFFCLHQNKSIIQIAEISRDKLTPKEQHDVYRCKMKYGFLFNGYRPDKYFWEILILYRKIILIMATVFLSVVSPESQVLVALMVVIINMFAHVFYEPFYTGQLNKMEMYSLQVVSITMYCGLFYITGEHYTYMENNFLKWFFFICLIVPNVLFFFYWIFFFQIEMVIIIFHFNKKLFRCLTCGCVDLVKFEYKYVSKVEIVKAEEVKQQQLENTFMRSYTKKQSALTEEQSEFLKGPEDIEIEFPDDKGFNSPNMKLKKRKNQKGKKKKLPSTSVWREEVSQEETQNMDLQDNRKEYSLTYDDHKEVEGGSPQRRKKEWKPSPKKTKPNALDAGEQNQRSLMIQNNAFSPLFSPREDPEGRKTNEKLVEVAEESENEIDKKVGDIILDEKIKTALKRQEDDKQRLMRYKQ